MSKKKLNIGSIQNELEGASLFFAKSPPVGGEQPAGEHSPVSSLDGSVKHEEQNQAQIPTYSQEQTIAEESAVMPSRSHDGTQSRRQDSTPSRSHDGTQSSGHAVMPSRTHEERKQAVLKALSNVGTHKGTVRLTQKEKAALARAVFNYTSSGINISENEIMRMALNYLLEEDEHQGSNSLLDDIVRSLKK